VERRIGFLEQHRERQQLGQPDHLGELRLLHDLEQRGRLGHNRVGHPGTERQRFRGFLLFGREPLQHQQFGELIGRQRWLFLHFAGAVVEFVVRRHLLELRPQERVGAGGQRLDHDKHDFRQRQFDVVGQFRRQRLGLVEYLGRHERFDGRKRIVVQLLEQHVVYRQFQMVGGLHDGDSAERLVGDDGNGLGLDQFVGLGHIQWCLERLERVDNVLLGRDGPEQYE
jgi:hypothetical protein